MLYQVRNPHGGDIYGKEIALDFSANTNPYGTPQGVLAAIQNTLPQIWQYPDPYCRELVAAISDFEGVPCDYILCGNGAAELIYSYCEAIRPKTAVELAPTFSEYSSGLQRVGAKVKRYRLKAEQRFVLDEDFLPFLEDAKPEVVFLCNPNNPTGVIIDPKRLTDILCHTKRHNIRLFIDECFLDLSACGESLKGHLSDNPQLLILKAFTKSYGMAGVRLGYCMSSDAALLRKMSQTVQPWNVSVVAQAAGVAALKEQDFLVSAKKTIVSEKRWLITQLIHMGFTVCPSDANYLLFQGPAGLHTALQEFGIAIRNCDNYYGLGSGWYRIAVRLHNENERLISAIRSVL